MQAQLQGRAVARTVRRSGLPSILSGVLFDDRGNRMSPSHANKRGVRYRYYVSQAVLQNRGDDRAGKSRVSAPDIEDLVIAALRQQVPTEQDASDRDLVIRHVERIVLQSKQVEIVMRDILVPPTIDTEHLQADNPAGEPCANDCEPHHTGSAQNVLVLPWSAAPSRVRKGVAFAPADRPRLDPHSRDVLLVAIAKARRWMDSLVEGRISSFGELAEAEGKAERHIRRLVPLAFLSPRIVRAIADGSAPGDLTVTNLTAALPHGWADQDRKFAIG